jgi:GDPmannose 4,6-dehydratase
MWMMLQRPEPGDYVIATGQSHSIRDFLDLAGRFCGVDWRSRVQPDPRYLRPSEVDHLLGDARKAHAELGWTPKMSFEQLVKLMVDSDMELARQELTLAKAGHRVILRGSAHA